MNSQIAICHFKKSNYNREVENIKETEFGTTDYAFLTNDTTLKHNDIVVVDTKYGMELAKFDHYSTKLVDRDLATKYIICTVDTKEFEEERRKEDLKAELLQQMRAMRDSALELEVFETLSKTNPQMADLLNKYNAIL